MKQAIRNKLRKCTGISIGEVLAALMIIALVTQGLAAGIAVAYRQYRNANNYSNAQLLYSTLETVITGELRFLEPSEEMEPLISLDYRDQKAEYGELALWDGETYNRILESASYPDGLMAKAEAVYDPDRERYTVFLSIAKEDDILIEGNGFLVLALND